QPADILTKPLPIKQFITLRDTDGKFSSSKLLYFESELSHDFYLSSEESTFYEENEEETDSLGQDLSSSLSKTMFCPLDISRDERKCPLSLYGYDMVYDQVGGWIGHPGPPLTPDMVE